MSHRPTGRPDRDPEPPGRSPSATRAARTRRQNRVRQLADVLAHSAREVGAVAMNPTVFVQAMLPHSEVYLLGADGRPVEVSTSPTGDPTAPTQKLLAPHYSATNGEFTLTVRAGTRPGPSHLHPQVSRGVPYGGLARLLLCHVITEALKRDSRVIGLGDTLTAFCRSVDVTPSGGRNGRLRYVLDQLQRLATCAVTYEWDTPGPGRRDLHGEQLLVVDAYRFWHRGETPTSEAADGGTLVLSDRFWSEVVSRSFPLDLRKAQLLRANPTAYDLYLWLTHRLAALQRTGQAEVAVGYDHLHAQLGSHYQTDADGALTPRAKKNFGYKVRGALKTIGAMWPALSYETPRGRVVLHNTGPDVEPRPSRRHA